jgi:hypothetical protein
MTPEELQRTMEFIVEQQAKFEADIQKLFESDKQTRLADDRLRESQGTLTAALVRLAEIVEDLGEAQKKTDAGLRKTDASLRETDKRLNILVNVVEKQLIRRRNGRKRGK